MQKQSDMQTAAAPATGIQWDLRDLYASIHDPQIEIDLKTAGSKAAQFEKTHKPLFDNPAEITAAHLVRLLDDYKEIATFTARLGSFAYLTFAENTNLPETGAFLQKMRVSLTDIHAHLVFFEVRWNQLDSAVASRLASDPSLESSRHFLEKLRIFAPHTLTEGEEKIMAIKSNTSDGAFARLFDEVMNNIPFTMHIDGKRVKKTEAEILAALHSKNREDRKASSEALAEGLTENRRMLTYIYNMILADHRATSKIRRYRHPMNAMNLSNEISLESVLNLIQHVKKAYPIAMRYYRLKKKLLHLDSFFDYDRYAPIGEEDGRIDFGECREIVLSGYREFSEDAGKIAEEFFTKRWIDAEVRPGKQGGGFCAQTTPELHPYILVNYTGTARDVMTVAHELGHGLHQTLAAKRVGILESSAPLTMAETASVFGEMLIFEKILSGEQNRAKRLALLCGKIDDNFATVFRQIAMTDFELRSHQAGLDKGELLEEDLNHFWIRANTDLYGESVTLTDHYRHGWKYIPHFIHSPFYCYAYAFAQLFVLSLFQKYKENKQEFVPKYFNMLSLGGSRKPEEIAQMAGLDIRHPQFWQGGIQILDQLVTQAEELKL